ncbi:AAA family ATPase [Roseibacillus persicicus]|uniref:ATP-dependent nuclease n=1 Tax=Roseibacillus persicicus TaxID=454148 RepID=UPI00398B3203
MHSLTHLKIVNFRSCLTTELNINDFTPIVGYNNAGKSTILFAVEWLLTPSALAITDFNVAGEPIVVEGKIEGIEEAILNAMPNNHANAIRPYIENGVIRIRRRMLSPGAASTAKIEVRDLTVTNEMSDEAWRNNPTGLDGAIKAIFPAPIRVQAMEKANDDVGKSSKTNTIGRLIAAITEEVKRAHEEEFQEALMTIRNRLAADGNNRAEELQSLDTKTSAQLADLFPGLSLKIDLAPPDIPDLFKSGTVQVIESEGPGSVRSFDSVGHGAQRCIQMALIRHLASRTASGDNPRTTLLLIDEPELFLHPQGIEQVRLALKKLSQNGYQVVFSTHSPAMITRDSAPVTVIVRKSGSPLSTAARNPLREAATTAIEDAPHQSRMIFELGRASEVFFSDKVLLGEGKTEGRLLPVAYEALRGKSLKGDRLGLVPVDSSNNLIPAKKILTEMQIDSVALADLDFAFKVAPRQGILPASDADLVAARPVLLRLSTLVNTDFQLESDGLPKKGGTLKPADAWAAFAADNEGRQIAERLHQKLLAHGIWLWKVGTIEDALGGVGKGEDAIQALELSLPMKAPASIRDDLPEITALLDWFSSV